MRVLWLTNMPLPAVCEKLNIKQSNKEGWLSGILKAVSSQEQKDFELSIAFPVDRDHDEFLTNIDGVDYYGFYEDTAHPENYDEELEARLKRIVTCVNPDVIHIFGTEYPHTLAMCRAASDFPERVLIGMQGLMGVYKDHYYDDVPKKVINRLTFRDIVRKDELRMQQYKFELRAENEVKALKLAGNVTGRTEFDLRYTSEINPDSKYFFMNESLRDDFYEGEWNEALAERHSIFFSQANYPIKGAHYVLRALPELKTKYPDIKLYFAGDNITKHKTLKDKLKLSSYGKYLLELIDRGKLQDNVLFLGSLSAHEVKARLLKSNLFLCTSTIENSPNSLGEAMILGVPCVTCNVGGIPSIFRNGSDGIMYHAGNKAELIDAIDRMFSDEDLRKSSSIAAKAHAEATHNRSENYKRLLEIYKEIAR